MISYGTLWHLKWSLHKEANNRFYKGKRVKDYQLSIMLSLDELGGAKVFSKIDLRPNYWQIRTYVNSIKKTTFKTHKDYYEFIVMPFDLTNTPSTF